jgi:hypothetical protein
MIGMSIKNQISRQINITQVITQSSSDKTRRYINLTKNSKPKNFSNAIN